MNTRYKLCTAITVLNWIEIPLIIVMFILEVSAFSQMNTTTNEQSIGLLSSGLGFIAVSLIITAMGIASIVCSIILLVKNKPNSVNNGLTIAVGVCGIVFPIANLVLGIILCEKLKHEGSDDNRSAPY